VIRSEMAARRAASSAVWESCLLVYLCGFELDLVADLKARFRFLCLRMEKRS